MGRLSDLEELHGYLVQAYYKAYALNKGGALKRPLVQDLLRLTNVTADLVDDFKVSRGLDPDPGA